MTFFENNYKNLVLLSHNASEHNGYRNAQLGALYSIGAHFFITMSQVLSRCLQGVVRPQLL